MGLDQMKKWREVVEREAERVARLGAWPAWVDPSGLVERLPSPGAVGRGGFDAGVACALDLIPRDRQTLSATLHASYSPAVVERLRADIAQGFGPDSEICWWLAACRVCTEGDATEQSFTEQVDDFTWLANSPEARFDAALECLDDMLGAYELVGLGGAQVAVALRDGGMQGAYLAGHDLCASYDEIHDLYFLGTFHASLGLENFAWKEPGDPAATDVESRRGRSGPVHGSRQYVKCADVIELGAARAAVVLGD